MKKLFLLVILVLFVPYLFISFGTDANVYSYMGKLVFDGGVPYVDGWDHKGISLYLINAIGYGAFGFKSFIGIRILELLLILIVFLRYFKDASQHFSKLIALISGIFGLFTMKYFFDGGNMTEEYGLLFALLSALLLLKKQVKTLDYALVGAFFILNFTIRANLIAFWVALFFVYILQLLLKQKSFKEILLSFLKMGYGAAAISLILFVYMWITGSFSAFIDAAFTFNFSYSSATPDSGSTLSSLIGSMKRYHLSILLVIGFLVSLMRFFKDKNRFLELLLILWIPIELYFSNISHRMYAHYFLMWVPLIMLSVAVTLQEVKERFQVSNAKTIVASVLLFAVCFYIPSYMTLLDYKKLIASNEPSKSEIIVEHIKTNYPDHSLLVWGNSCDIYNQTNKQSPITYFYHSVFKYDTELTREMIQEFTDQVIKKRPELIVDAKRNGMLALDVSNESETDAGQKNNFGRFLQHVADYYVVKEEKEGWVFYELRTKHE
jgi:hypothetical protein